MSNIIKQNSKEHQEILVEIEKINERLDDRYISRNDFAPVQRIVYGMVGILLTGIMYGLLKLIGTHGVL